MLLSLFSEALPSFTRIDKTFIQNQVYPSTYVKYMNSRELFGLDSKVAVVTGGSSGIGKSIAKGLVEAGAEIAICARNAKRCRECASELSKIGKKVVGIGCDVGNPTEVNTLFERVIREFGKVDILVNNAGIAWAGSPQDLRIDDWEKVMKVNVTGTFLCSQVAGKIMIKQCSGRIINITSVFGLLGTDIIDAISYNASKGAIISFTKDLAVKWAKYNIKVNAIAFSYAKTHLTEWAIKNRRNQILRRTPLGRLLEEDDIKGVAIFLASNASNYVTGQVLCVDGGWTSI